MTSLKRAVLQTAKMLGLFHAARWLTQDGVRILCYHGVWLGRDDMVGDAMFMSRTTFERRLDRIAALGYPVVTLDSVAAARNNGAALPPAAVVITIDDGWFSTYDAMVPALAARSMPATLYCDTAHLTEGLPIAHVMARYCRGFADPTRIGEEAEHAYNLATDRSRPMADRLVAARSFCEAVGIDADSYLSHRVFDYMSPAQLRATRDAGIDIQLHTHNHTLGDMSANRIAAEIDANRQELAALLHEPPQAFQHFCYPSGVASDAAAQTLQDLGLASSTTTQNRIAFAAEHSQLLPRFLDGEQVSALEFEAELSGFSHLARTACQHAATTCQRLVAAARPARTVPVPSSVTS